MWEMMEVSDLSNHTISTASSGYVSLSGKTKGPRNVQSPLVDREMPNPLTGWTLVRYAGPASEASTHSRPVGSELDGNGCTPFPCVQAMTANANGGRP